MYSLSKRTLFQQLNKRISSTTTSSTIIPLSSSSSLSSSSHISTRRYVSTKELTPQTLPTDFPLMSEKRPLMLLIMY